MLVWDVPEGAAGSGRQQNHPPAAEQVLDTSWCLAKCDELETTCIAYEHRFPSCSPNDICLDEKIQCTAKCRPTSRRLSPEKRTIDRAEAFYRLGTLKEMGGPSCLNVRLRVQGAVSKEVASG